MSSSGEYRFQEYTSLEELILKNPILWVIVIIYRVLPYITLGIIKSIIITFYVFEIIQPFNKIYLFNSAIIWIINNFINKPITFIYSTIKEIKDISFGNSSYSILHFPL